MVEARNPIEAALWPVASAPALGVWAVLDCARDPAVYRALLESRLDIGCLYAGSMPRELELVAPHLVELIPGHRLTRQLLGPSWGRSWGIYLRVADPSNLRHHLRKFLKVRDETGRRMLFRYYDPRVLRTYLPTCTAPELQAFFGPVQAFLLEDHDGAALLSFTQQRGVLDRRSQAVASHAGA